MKVILRSLVVSGLLLIPAAAYSQGSGSTAPAKPKGKTPSRNFVVTRSFSGVVSSTSEASIAVENSKGEIITFIVANKTRVGSGCMTVGRKVTVTYAAKDKKATAVRCK